MERLISKLMDLRLIRSFKVRTTPRWIILLLDMLIVMVSYVATVIAGMYSAQSLTASTTIREVSTSSANSSMELESTTC